MDEKKLPVDMPTTEDAPEADIEIVEVTYGDI